MIHARAPTVNGGAEVYAGEPERPVGGLACPARSPKNGQTDVSGRGCEEGNACAGSSHGVGRGSAPPGFMKKRSVRRAGRDQHPSSPWQHYRTLSEFRPARHPDGSPTRSGLFSCSRERAGPSRKSRDPASAGPGKSGGFFVNSSPPEPRMTSSAQPSLSLSPLDIAPWPRILTIRAFVCWWTVEEAYIAQPGWCPSGSL